MKTSHITDGADCNPDSMGAGATTDGATPDGQSTVHTSAATTNGATPDGQSTVHPSALPCRDIRRALAERILVLDGAMGTMVQRYNLTERDFRGPRFADLPTPLKGCNDVLVLTRPDVITAIHEAYLAAGADIISTDSFNANAVSMADYGLQEQVYEINLAAARLARAAADRFEARGRARYVAGSMGPTNRTASLAANADDPAWRDVTFAELVEAYHEQARGLVDGGADVLLVETVFDTLNAKAALFAISRLNAERAECVRVSGGFCAPIPVMVSGTIADTSGRTLSGQTVEAFLISLKHGAEVGCSGAGAGCSGAGVGCSGAGAGGFGPGAGCSGAGAGGFGPGADPEIEKNIHHSGLLSIGLNCAFGARQMLPYLERLAGAAECMISTHPNAGLPNLSGGYDETPEIFAADIEEFLRRGIVNIVGGCCGTTPEHTRLLAALVEEYSPRPFPLPRHATELSGLEPLILPAGPLTLPPSEPITLPPATLDPTLKNGSTPPSSPDFLKIGERANVAGSAKFARLIREQKWDEAIGVAREQVAQGADIVDICMDDGMIDGPAAMRRFLLMAAAEPELARVPWMIDSSSWEVLETGLQCVQGRCIVNSISLKEGPGEFLRRARLVRRYGAAAVVMLFDERGQADTFARKIEVAERAYNLLTSSGFPPEDIIFDPNVLTVATGIPEHDNYGVDFIEATRWIKQNLPHTRVSAGVSNLSFAMRGNGAVREAMHSVFLFWARRAGLDMGIVNAGILLNYNELEPRLRELAEDVVLNRRADATERLTDFAQELKAAQAGSGAGSGTGSGAGSGAAAIPLNKESIANRPDTWRQNTVTERIRHAVLKGIDEHIGPDAIEAYNALGSPMSVIDSVLMPAMGEVGVLFGEGKMFLPQVVRSARVMRRAVDALSPYISSSKTSRKSAGKLLLATVRGDVHDIGKNIVGVVASTAGWDVIDLGVMVEATKIADEAERNSVNAIGLSGLITPSLDEMIGVVRELRRRGITTPVLIGGATTSRLHTAVKIAPEYGDGIVVHSRDASENVRVIAALTGPDAERFKSEILAQQQIDRQLHNVTAASCGSLPLAEARRNSFQKKAEAIAVPAHVGRVVFDGHPIAEVEPYINWSMFYAAWQVRGNDQKQQLRDDAEKLLARIVEENILRLEGVVGIFPARRGRADEAPGASCKAPETAARMSPGAALENPGATAGTGSGATAGTGSGSTPENLVAPAENPCATAETGSGATPENPVAPAENPGATDDIVITDPRGAAGAGRDVRLPQLRSQAPGKKVNLSVADYVTGDGRPLKPAADPAAIPAANPTDRAADPAQIPAANPTDRAANPTDPTATAEPAKVQDYIGAFALTAGVGLRAFTEQLREAGDEYNAIMAKLLADRLTEAFAEWVHEFVRRVMWGYQRDETGQPIEIQPIDAIHGKYRGKRFAFGYPATPDHSQKQEIFALLGVRQTTSMSLTDNYMIDPGESLCGLIVADADAEYFTLGTLDDEQIADYARRRGKSAEEIKKLIIKE